MSKTSERVRTPPKVPTWVNRLMTGLLRSPFSRTIDRGIMLLTVHGRRTGRGYTFPVQYVEDGDVLWVMSGGGEEKTWWRNLVGGARVEIVLRRRGREGRGVAFTHEAQPEVVEQGMRRYLERFPGMGKRMGVSSDDDEAFRRLVEQSVMVRIDLDPAREGARAGRDSTPRPAA